MLALAPVAGHAALVAPGMLLLAVFLMLVRPLREPLMAITALIIGFVLIRDAMTPAALWRLGAAGGVPWIRMADDPVVLLVLAGGIGGATALLLAAGPRIRALVQWGPFGPGAVLCGLAGGLLAAAPVLAAGAAVPLADRGGAVAAALLPALLAFTLVGNLTEEVLFRGALQGRLAASLGAWRAAAAGAVLFAACHAPLAYVVTGAGAPLLLFTLWEGLICGALRVRYGVIAAALAHGTAIFLLAAGLV